MWTNIKITMTYHHRDEQTLWEMNRHITTTGYHDNYPDKLPDICSKNNVAEIGCIDPTYILDFTLYLGMPLICTDFPMGSKQSPCDFCHFCFLPVWKSVNN